MLGGVSLFFKTSWISVEFGQMDKSNEDSNKFFERTSFSVNEPDKVDSNNNNNKKRG